MLPHASTTARARKEGCIMKCKVWQRKELPAMQRIHFTRERCVPTDFPSQIRRYRLISELAVREPNDSGRAAMEYSLGRRALEILLTCCLALLLFSNKDNNLCKKYTTHVSPVSTLLCCSILRSTRSHICSGSHFKKKANSFPLGICPVGVNYRHTPAAPPQTPQ